MMDARSIVPDILMDYRFEATARMNERAGERTNKPTDEPTDGRTDERMMITTRSLSMNLSIDGNIFPRVTQQFD